MNRIVFTGAQGTGKTTVLNIFKERGKNVITEVVRNLSSDLKIKINKNGDEEGQNIIFNEYKKLLSQITLDGYISDRCLIDVFAYTKHLFETNKVSEDFVIKQLNEIKQFVKDNPDIIYCYFPIEFPVVDDGVRDTDEEYRKYIDNNIREIIKILGVNVVTITGTVEERVNKLERIYAWRQEGFNLFHNQ